MMRDFANRFDSVYCIIRDVIFRGFEKPWNLMVKHHKITYAVILGTLLIGFVTQ